MKSVKPSARKETPKNVTSQASSSAHTKTVGDVPNRLNDVRTGTFLPEGPGTTQRGLAHQMSSNPNLHSNGNGGGGGVPASANSKHNISAEMLALQGVGGGSGVYPFASASPQSSYSSSAMPSSSFFPDEFMSNNQSNHQIRGHTLFGQSPHSNHTNYDSANGLLQQQSILRQHDARYSFNQQQMHFKDAQSFSAVANVIAKHGLQSEKYVPMVLFQETMGILERRLNSIEQRLEDNESMVHLNDRLLDLRNVSATQMTARSRTQLDNSNVSAGDNYISSFDIETSRKPHIYKPDQLSTPNHQQRKQQQQLLQQQQSQQQQQSDSHDDFTQRLAIVEKRIGQYEGFAKNVIADVEKKFIEYGKKLNVQIDKFFKTASTKLEQNSEKDQKLSVLAEAVERQLEVFKQTYRLKDEELTINKEEIASGMKTLSALLGKLENRINEHSIDITENRTLIKAIEDDFFVMLHNYKDVSEKVLTFRNVYDEVAFLKLNQGQMLKHLNLSVLHCFQNV